jgi:hypothetical protein
MLIRIIESHPIPDGDPGTLQLQQRLGADEVVLQGDGRDAVGLFPVEEGAVGGLRGQAALLAAGEEPGDAGPVPDGAHPGAGQAHPLALQRQADWAPLQPGEAGPWRLVAERSLVSDPGGENLRKRCVSFES